MTPEERAEHESYVHGCDLETLVAARADLSRRRVHGRTDPDGVWMLNRIEVLTCEINRLQREPAPCQSSSTSS